MALRLLLSAAMRRGTSAQSAISLLAPALGAAAPTLVAQGPPCSCRDLAAPHAAAATAGLRTSAGLPASAAAALASVLDKEIKHEKTVYERDEAVASGPPAPFVLSSTPGDTAVSLTRDFKGEKVSVDCSVNMQDSLALPFDDKLGADEDDNMDEEEDDSADGADVNFNVTVTKGASSLVFECISDGTYVDVRHVSLEPAGGLESETSYTGPVFAELDEQLQSGFRDYLQERGIDEDLGEYLRQLMHDKEQEEYMRWLSAVRAFVA